VPHLVGAKGGLAMDGEDALEEIEVHPPKCGSGEVELGPPS
jgi:hypothetical protein